MTRYVSAEKMTHDDFGVPFTGRPGELVYDAPTRDGRWATMTRRSWLSNGATRRLGVGLGQQYRRNEKGQLILVAGGTER